MPENNYLRKLAGHIGWHLTRWGHGAPSRQELRAAPWNAADGDRTHRLEYDLNENSVVFDLGGYQGDWSSDIFSMYCCNLHIFEVVDTYFCAIQKRFSHNPKISIYPFGLSSSESTTTIRIADERSSQFGNVGEVKSMAVMKAADFFQTRLITRVDLMKVNIEGGEYELIEHLLDTGHIAKIANLQVQFHDFVPNAEGRMEAIYKRLRATHDITYHFPFVWDNWRLKGEQSPAPSEIFINEDMQTA